MEMPCLPVPEVMPAQPTEFPGPQTDAPSFCTIESLDGLGVTLWSDPKSLVPSDRCEVQLQLSPQAHVIIGRANGGQIEYLDPSYVPSCVMPGTGQTILRHGGAAMDRAVSRAHFMLSGHARGIRLLNGVPRRGGGIRPPRNWTELLDPQKRMLLVAEELVIDRGAWATIRLPNDTRLTIRAQ